MIRGRRSRRFRPAFALAAIAVSLLLGGCVYLRLLQLKRQLAAFDRNFTVQSTSGLRLGFVHPVLLADDVRFLGFWPKTVRKLGQAEQWHVRWVKRLPPGATEKGTYEIAFDLFFAGDKLSALQIPESYFAFMPKEVIVAGLRSLGGAKVDKRDRSVQGDVLAALPDKVVPPSQKSVAEMLGVPTAERIEGQREILRYHFRSDDPGGKGKDFDLQLVFDARSGDLLETSGRMPVGRIHLKFDQRATIAPNDTLVPHSPALP